VLEAVGTAFLQYSPALPAVVLGTHYNLVTALRKQLQMHIGLLGDWQPAAAGDEQVREPHEVLDDLSCTTGDSGSDKAATAVAEAAGDHTNTAAAAAAATAAAAGAAGSAADDNAPDWCAVTAPPPSTAAGDEPAMDHLLKLYMLLQESFDEAYDAHEDHQKEKSNKAFLELLLSLMRLGLRLQHFGGAVCAALPVRFCCNNVQCLSLAGFSEQQQVAGRKNTCSGCKVAR
jgi:hypothetical protein